MNNLKFHYWKKSSREMFLSKPEVMKRFDAKKMKTWILFLLSQLILNFFENWKFVWSYISFKICTFFGVLLHLHKRNDWSFV